MIFTNCAKMRKRNYQLIFQVDISYIVLLLTLSVTAATAEGSFSKLKIIKNYLRSKMAQERLNALAIISIEAEETKKVEIDRMIDVFAQKKARSNRLKI